MLLATTVALGGCALLSGTASGPGFQGGASCAELSGGACQEQIDLATARHPGATQLDLACTAAVCDRAGGAGTVVVTLASGARITETFRYVGNPAPVPAPTCAGMAVDICRRLARTTVDDVSPSKAISAVSIACSAASCTADRGEADVRVRFADGTEFRTNSGWEGGSP